MDARVMKKMTHFVLVLMVALSVAATIDLPKAEAQDLEISGPLAGAPAVMRLRIYREGRFQIKAMGAMTLQDEFTRAMLFGGQLTYHITDWLGIGVWGGFAPVQFDTSLTEQIQKKGQTNDRNVLSLPRRQNFPDQIGKIKYIIAPQVVFIPLRGKLGMFESLFVDTDFFVNGGVGIIGVEERADVDVTTCRGVGDPTFPTCVNSQAQRTSRVAIAPTFGVGLSFYFTDYLAMTWEWRAFPFSWNTSGTDEGGSGSDFPDGRVNSDDYIFHFNHLASVGFAFYLPTEPELSYYDKSEMETTVEVGPPPSDEKEAMPKEAGEEPLEGEESPQEGSETETGAEIEGGAEGSVDIGF